MCRSSRILLSHLLFYPPSAEKLLLQLHLAILLICLSSSPHCETWQAEPSPHHSSLLLSCLRDESFSLQTKLLWVLFLARRGPGPVLLLLGALFAAFSDLFIHSWLWHLMHVKNLKVKTLHVHYAGLESNSYLKYTWMHEYIYCWGALVHTGKSHFLKWPCSGMEWRDPWRRPTCGHQIEPLGAPLTQWNGRGKGNDLPHFGGAGAVASKQYAWLRL